MNAPFSWTLDAGFAGGNIVLEAQNANGARLRQNWESSKEWWFSWAFRVRGAQGRTLRFEFCDGDVFGASGPCARSGSNEWRWLGLESESDNGFSYEFAEGETEVYFGFCPLYTQRHLDEFLACHPLFERHQIGVSRDGHAVELVKLCSRQARVRVLLLARTHACEAMANFVLEGIFAAWERDPFLREWADLEAVPLLDIDGVEAGEQGKRRRPHDHNQDWTNAPLYPETRAVMNRVRAEPEFVACLDFHCPWIRGGRNERLFFFDARAAPHSALPAFGRLLESTQGAGLGFRAASTADVNDPFNSGDTPTATAWLAQTTNAALCAALEVPYSRCGEVEMTPRRARAFGEDLGRALGLWLKTRNN